MRKKRPVLTFLLCSTSLRTKWWIAPDFNTRWHRLTFVLSLKTCIVISINVIIPGTMERLVHQVATVSISVCLFPAPLTRLFSVSVPSGRFSVPTLMENLFYKLPSCLSVVSPSGEKYEWKCEQGCVNVLPLGRNMSFTPQAHCSKNAPMVLQVAVNCMCWCGKHTLTAYVNHFQKQQKMVHCASYCYTHFCGEIQGDKLTLASGFWWGRSHTLVRIYMAFL